MKNSIREFYFYLVGNNHAHSTARGYRTILEHFEITHPGITLEKVTPQMLQDYLSKFQNLSPSSRNIKKAAFRSFFKWCLENELVRKDPSRLLKFERGLQKELSYFTPEQARRFLSVIENERDRVIFTLFLHTGLRLSELASISVGMVKGKDRFLINGKGGKSRKIFLSSFLTKLVEKTLNGRGDEKPLFESKRGTKLSTSQIQSLFKLYLRKARIKGKFCVHSLRHSFATALYSRTKDIRLVQELLGHASIQTTMIYSHVNPSDKVKAINGLWR